MSNALAVTGGGELTPEEILGKQTKVVNALRFLINKKTVVFVDKKTGKESRHIEAMAWQSIAAAFGVMPKITSVQEDEQGMLAHCVLTKFSTGEVIGENSAYVGRDEKQWYGGRISGKNGSYELQKKPMNQIRSCAQTRAIRQAIKVALGHVAIFLEEMGVDPNQSAEERVEEEKVIEETQALLPPMSPAQWETIKAKKKLSGITNEEMINRFGPSDKLTEESAKVVIAHLDGLIASKEGAVNG